MAFSESDKNNINKRILLLVDQVCSSAGGTEQHISFLMRSLPKHNCEIYFGVLRELGELDVNMFPVEPFCLDFKSFWSFKQIVRSTQQLIDFIKTNDIRILQTFFPDSELLGLLAVRKISTCTLVATRRNMGYFYTWRSLWLRRMTSQFIPNYLANCEAVREQTYSNEWVQKSKIHVIYNPFPIHRYDQVCYDKAYEFTKKEKGEIFVGMVANVRPVKNYENFIKAASIVNAKHPNVKFLIVGSTCLSDYKMHIDNLIANLNLTKYVIFTNEVRNSLPLIDLFDIGVLSSSSEGFSNSLIEYAMLGVPTVATDVGGNSEIVLNHRTGFIVPNDSSIDLAQSILKLVESAKKRKEFGRKAKALCMHKFSPHVIISDYLDYYQTLLKQNKLLE